jgi:acetyl-CoA acetyltransferase
MDEHPGDLAPAARAQIVELFCQQAQNNPYAQRLGEKVTAEQVLHSRYVVYPVRSLETCVYTEGACALIFASGDLAQRLKERTHREPIWITGVGAANEPYFVGSDITRYKVLHRIYSDYLATRTALAQARLTINDIQVIELHDAFIPQVMITLAEMGVVPLGRANDLVEEGLIMPGGKFLVNPSGGLVFGGHFVGGSNMMSAWSIMRELRARNFQHGLIHGTGASLSMYGVAMVLERRV